MPEDRPSLTAAIVTWIGLGGIIGLGGGVLAGAVLGVLVLIVGGDPGVVAVWFGLSSAYGGLIGAGVGFFVALVRLFVPGPTGRTVASFVATFGSTVGLLYVWLAAGVVPGFALFLAAVAPVAVWTGAAVWLVDLWTAGDADETTPREAPSVDDQG